MVSGNSSHGARVEDAHSKERTDSDYEYEG